MSNPSWSMDGVTFAEFPGWYRWGGKPGSIEEALIEHESDSGVEFTYLQFTRRTWLLNFTFTHADYDTYYNFALNTQGKAPFYFSPTGAGVVDSVLVRRDPGFDPQERDHPTAGVMPLWDLTIMLKTIPDNASVSVSILMG